jgi:hypothetical protein
MLKMERKTWLKIALIGIGICLLVIMVFAYLNFLDAGYYCQEYCKCKFLTDNYKYVPGTCACEYTRPPVVIFNSSFLGNKT